MLCIMMDMDDKINGSSSILSPQYSTISPLRHYTPNLIHRIISDIYHQTIANVSLSSSPNIAKASITLVQLLAASSTIFKQYQIQSPDDIIFQQYLLLLTIDREENWPLKIHRLVHALVENQQCSSKMPVARKKDASILSSPNSLKYEGKKNNAKPEISNTEYYRSLLAYDDNLSPSIKKCVPKFTSPLVSKKCDKIRPPSSPNLRNFPPCWTDCLFHWIKVTLTEKIYLQNEYENLPMEVLRRVQICPQSDLQKLITQTTELYKWQLRRVLYHWASQVHRSIRNNGIEDNTLLVIKFELWRLYYNRCKHLRHATDFINRKHKAHIWRTWHRTLYFRINERDSSVSQSINRWKRWVITCRHKRIRQQQRHNNVRRKVWIYWLLWLKSVKKKKRRYARIDRYYKRKKLLQVIQFWYDYAAQMRGLLDIEIYVSAKRRMCILRLIWLAWWNIHRLQVDVIDCRLSNSILLLQQHGIWGHWKTTARLLRLSRVLARFANNYMLHVVIQQWNDYYRHKHSQKMQIYTGIRRIEGIKKKAIFLNWKKYLIVRINLEIQVNLRIIQIKNTRLSRYVSAWQGVVRKIVISREKIATVILSLNKFALQKHWYKWYEYYRQQNCLNQAIALQTKTVHKKCFIRLQKHYKQAQICRIISNRHMQIWLYLHAWKCWRDSYIESLLTRREMKQALDFSNKKMLRQRFIAWKAHHANCQRQQIILNNAQAKAGKKFIQHIWIIWRAFHNSRSTWKKLYMNTTIQWRTWCKLKYLSRWLNFARAAKIKLIHQKNVVQIRFNIQNRFQKEAIAFWKSYSESAKAYNNQSIAMERISMVKSVRKWRKYTLLQMRYCKFYKVNEMRKLSIVLCDWLRQVQRTRNFQNLALNLLKVYKQRLVKLTYKSWQDYVRVHKKYKQCEVQINQRYTSGILKSILQAWYHQVRHNRIKYKLNASAIKFYEMKIVLPNYFILWKSFGQRQMDKHLKLEQSKAHRDKTLKFWCWRAWGVLAQTNRKINNFIIHSYNLQLSKNFAAWRWHIFDRVKRKTIHATLTTKLSIFILRLFTLKWSHKLQLNKLMRSVQQQLNVKVSRVCFYKWSKWYKLNKAYRQIVKVKVIKSNRCALKAWHSYVRQQLQYLSHVYKKIYTSHVKYVQRKVLQYWKNDVQYRLQLSYLQQSWQLHWNVKHAVHKWRLFTNNNIRIHTLLSTYYERHSKYHMKTRKALQIWTKLSKISKEILKFNSKQDMMLCISTFSAWVECINKIKNKHKTQERVRKIIKRIGVRRWKKFHHLVKYKIKLIDGLRDLHLGIANDWLDIQILQRAIVFNEVCADWKCNMPALKRAWLALRLRHIRKQEKLRQIKRIQGQLIERVGSTANARQIIITWQSIHLVKTFRHWVVDTKAKQHYRNIRKIIMKQHRSFTLKLYICRWTQNWDSRVRTRNLQEHYMQEVWTQWILRITQRKALNTKLIEAEMYYRTSKAYICIQSWKLNTNLQKRTHVTASKCSYYNMTHKLQIVINYWMSYTNLCKKYRRVILTTQVRWSKRISRQCYEEWKKWSIRANLQRTQLENHKINRHRNKITKVFIAWANYTSFMCKLSKKESDIRQTRDFNRYKSILFAWQNVIEEKMEINSRIAWFYTQSRLRTTIRQLYNYRMSHKLEKHAIIALKKKKLSCLRANFQAWHCVVGLRKHNKLKLIDFLHHKRMQKGLRLWQQAGVAIKVQKTKINSARECLLGKLSSCAVRNWRLRVENSCQQAIVMGKCDKHFECCCLKQALVIWRNQTLYFTELLHMLQQIQNRRHSALKTQIFGVWHAFTKSKHVLRLKAFQLRKDRNSALCSQALNIWQHNWQQKYLMSQVTTQVIWRRWCVYIARLKSQQDWVRRKQYRMLSSGISRWQLKCIALFTIRAQRSLAERFSKTHRQNRYFQSWVAEHTERQQRISVFLELDNSYIHRQLCSAISIWHKFIAVKRRRLISGQEMICMRQNKAFYKYIQVWKGNAHCSRKHGEWLNSIRHSLYTWILKKCITQWKDRISHRNKLESAAFKVRQTKAKRRLYSVVRGWKVIARSKEWHRLRVQSYTFRSIKIFAKLNHLEANRIRKLLAHIWQILNVRVHRKRLKYMAVAYHASKVTQRNSSLVLHTFNVWINWYINQRELFCRLYEIICRLRSHKAWSRWHCYHIKKAQERKILSHNLWTAQQSNIRKWKLTPLDVHHAWKCWRHIFHARMFSRLRSLQRYMHSWRAVILSCQELQQRNRDTRCKISRMCILFSRSYRRTIQVSFQQWREEIITRNSIDISSRVYHCARIRMKYWLIWTQKFVPRQRWKQWITQQSDIHFQINNLRKSVYVWNRRTNTTRYISDACIAVKVRNNRKKLCRVIHQLHAYTLCSRIQGTTFRQIALFHSQRVVTQWVSFMHIQQNYRAYVECAYTFYAANTFRRVWQIWINFVSIQNTWRKRNLQIQRYKLTNMIKNWLQYKGRTAVWALHREKLYQQYRVLLRTRKLHSSIKRWRDRTLGGRAKTQCRIKFIRTCFKQWRRTYIRKLAVNIAICSQRIKTRRCLLQWQLFTHQARLLLEKNKLIRDVLDFRLLSQYWEGWKHSTYHRSQLRYTNTTLRQLTLREWHTVTTNNVNERNTKYQVIAQMHNKCLLHQFLKALRVYTVVTNTQRIQRWTNCRQIWEGIFVRRLLKSILHAWHEPTQRQQLLGCIIHQRKRKALICIIHVWIEQTKCSQHLKLQLMKAEIYYNQTLKYQTLSKWKNLVFA